MAHVRVRLISGGMLDLLKDPGVEAALRKLADRVATTGRATAPVDTGAYRDGIKVWTDKNRTRVAAHVGSTDDKGAVIESKTGNLARALDSAGGV